MQQAEAGTESPPERQEGVALGEYIGIALVVAVTAVLDDVKTATVHGLMQTCGSS